MTNDYGPGFYLTPSLTSAHEWACRNSTIGYVNVYDLNIEGLKVLDLRDSTHYSILNWIAILLRFRILHDEFIKAFGNRINYIEKHYYIDVNEYDLAI